VLPEFSDGGALPTATRFGAGPQGRNLTGKLLADVGGDGGSGTFEVESALQFIGQQREV